MIRGCIFTICVYLSQYVYTSTNLCVPIKYPHSGVMRRSGQLEEEEAEEDEDAHDDDGSIGAPNREGQHPFSSESESDDELDQGA